MSATNLTATLGFGDCPRCLEHSMMIPPEINALSRTTRGVDDVSVWVCSDCGTDEGLEDAFNGGATPQSEWPVSGRTHRLFIQETNIQTAFLMNKNDE